MSSKRVQMNTFLDENSFKTQHYEPYYWKILVNNEMVLHSPYIFDERHSSTCLGSNPRLPSLSAESGAFRLFFASFSSSHGWYSLQSRKKTKIRPRWLPKGKTNEMKVDVSVSGFVYFQYQNYCVNSPLEIQRKLTKRLQKYFGKGVRAGRWKSWPVRHEANM